ncbi:replication protein A 70 kDa DNA-binding subunit D [Tanacetum coccineum]
MQSSVEICLHYGGILVRRRQGFDYIGGDSVMICGVNTYEFFYNQLLSWVVENVNCPDVGVVCYRVPELEKTAFGVDCGKSYEMDSGSSKVNVESPKCFWPLYTMPTAEENPGGCLYMDSFDNEVDMFITNQNRKLMDLKLKDNVSLFASETKPECSEVDIVTDHGLDVNCMNVDDFVKSHVVADVNDGVKLYVTKDMNPVGDISNKISVIESYRIENKSKHEMADVSYAYDDYPSIYKRHKANKHILPKKPELNDDMYNWVIDKYGKPNTDPEKAEPEKAEPETAELEKPELECSSTSESSSSDDSSSSKLSSYVSSYDESSSSDESDKEDDETNEQDDEIDEEAEDGKYDSDDELWSPKTIRTTTKNLISPKMKGASRRGEGPGQGEQGAGQERKDRMSKSSRYFQMIVQDEKGFKIHVIIDNFRLKAINKVFKRGMVVVISDFNVVPNDHNLKFTNHPYKIKFNPDTKARRSKRFHLRTQTTQFEVTKFFDRLGMNLNRDLPVDIIGGVIGWETEMTDVEASNGKIVKTLGITLKDSTGIVDCLVTSYLADKLLNYIITHEVKEMFYVKLQYARVHYDGEDPPMIYINENIGSKLGILGANEDDDDEENEEKEDDDDDDDEAEEDDGEDGFFKPMKFIDDSDEHDSDYDRSPSLAECEKFASKFDGLPDQEEKQDKDSQDNCDSDED